MPLYDIKYGNYIGRTKIRISNTSMQATFKKRLKDLGCNPGDNCEIYYKRDEQGRWIVTFVQETSPIVEA